MTDLASPAIADYLRSRRKAGASIMRLAHELRKSPATISRHLKRLKVPDPKLPRGPAPGSPAARRQLTPERLARNAAIVAQHREGRSLVEIGRLHGVSRQRVFQIVQKYGS